MNSTHLKSTRGFADYLRVRARELNLSHTDIARQSSIARQTWYRLLNSEIEEAKLSTLVSISKVLKVDVMQLIQMHMKSTHTTSGLVH